MAEDRDHDLICSYARNRTNEVFSELVHRHVDLVYSTALRIVGDTHLAEDLTQRVFIALDRHVARLRNRDALSSWLHETSRNLAISTVRSEQRRRLREQEAVSMNSNDSTSMGDLWDLVAPHLDEALAELREGDRDLILWRYFEHKTSRQIGERLGLSAEAAQKRVARALDRLQAVFATRGVVTPMVGLGVILATQTVQSAPAGLASTAIASVGAAASAFSASSILGIIMESAKAKMAVAATLVMSVTLPLVWQFKNNQVSQLNQQIAQTTTVRSEPAPRPIRSPRSDRDDKGPARVGPAKVQRSESVPRPIRSERSDRSDKLPSHPIPVKTE